MFIVEEDLNSDRPESGDNEVSISDTMSNVTQCYFNPSEVDIVVTLCVLLTQDVTYMRKTASSPDLNPSQQMLSAAPTAKQLQQTSPRHSLNMSSLCQYTL